MRISSQTLDNQLWTTLWVALGEVTVFCGSPFQSLEKLCKSSAHWATLCTSIKSIRNFSIVSSVIPVRDLVSFSDDLCLDTRQPCGGGHGDPPLETGHFPRLYQEGRHRPHPPQILCSWRAILTLGLPRPKYPPGLEFWSGWGHQPLLGNLPACKCSLSPPFLNLPVPD